MMRQTSVLGLSSSLLLVLAAACKDGSGGSGHGSSDAGNDASSSSSGGSSGSSSDGSSGSGGSSGSSGSSGNMVTLATSPDPQFLVVDAKNVYWTDDGEGSSGNTGTGTVLSVPIAG